jgi:hypothetical protein
MTENHEDEIIHRELAADVDNPAVAVAEIVADLEGTAVDELPTAYDCIDGMLTEIHSNPPSPDAQLEVTFTYAGYRISVDQRNEAKFVKVSDQQ